MRKALGLSTLVTLCAVGVTAQAAELEYGASVEFRDICMAGAGSVDTTVAKFGELRWEKTKNADMRDIVRPDDVLKTAKKPTAFTVDLEGGGQWMGGVGTVKVTRITSVYCSVVMVGGKDDTEDVLKDMRTLHPGEPTVASNAAETRYVFSSEDDPSVLIHQAIPVPGEDDIMMFRSIFVVPSP